jgi:hypothetical protein
MTETLKDMMNARAEAAPGPRIDLDAVMRTGRRRVWRNRAAGGTAAGAVVAAAALVVPALPLGSDDAAVTDPAPFETRKVTYAEGSTIHYGDRRIDVSPHVLSSFVQTDYGFVYVTQNRHRVYFTDGESSEPIGRTSRGDDLVADDSGGYVGWREDGQAVFYDTATGADVFRADLESGRRSCLTEYVPPHPIAIDDGTAYLCERDEVSAWDLSDQTETLRVDAGPDRQLHDVASGYLAWELREDDATTGSVMSQDPAADEPLFVGFSAADLSPNADYVYGYDTRDSELTVIWERANPEAHPHVPDGYPVWLLMQWIDDDRYSVAAYRDDGSGDPAGVPDLLVCSIQHDGCRVVGKAASDDILFPQGVEYW